MKNYIRLLLIVLLTMILLDGCELKLKIALFNNTGEVLTVRTKSKDIVISPGESAQFDYPTPEQSWIFHLLTEKCDYVYQVPERLEHYDWTNAYKTIPKAQVEKDFQIYLLPRTTTGVRSVAEYASLQQDGFPIHPISKICQITTLQPQ